MHVQCSLFVFASHWHALYAQSRFPFLNTAKELNLLRQWVRLANRTGFLFVKLIQQMNSFASNFIVCSFQKCFVKMSDEWKWHFAVHIIVEIKLSLPLATHTQWSHSSLFLKIWATLSAERKRLLTSTLSICCAQSFGTVRNGFNFFVSHKTALCRVCDVLGQLLQDFYIFALAMSFNSSLVINSSKAAAHPLTLLTLPNGFYCWANRN